MAVEVKVPGVGESVQEGMIESWKKQNGEWIERDEILLELETDKATVEVAAEASGVLEILVAEGEVVQIGDLIAKIDEQGTPAGGSSTKASAPEKSEDSPSHQEKKADNTANSPSQNHGPAVNRIAQENNVDVSQIKGSGKDGRATKGDVIAHLDKESSTPPTKTAASSSQTLKANSQETHRKPMSMLRRRIAERLLSAQQGAAILTTFNEVDMTEVMALRKRYKDAFQEKFAIKLGFMGFFLKASALALQECPDVNAYIEGNEILYHNYCDIGVAVSTAKGLMVPIVRNVHQMSLAEIELAIGEYAVKARNNKISLDDLNGGTFTVSNGGVFGSLLSTPIINPPQSAILGMHKTQMRPMVMPDGKIEARPMMYLALSYDHRIIDGKEAVTFLVHIKDAIEDPSRMLLGV